jgi:murein DD-endopeptidase MepM/ murein hydrolase activator NlpD
VSDDSKGTHSVKHTWTALIALAVLFAPTAATARKYKKNKVIGGVSKPGSFRIRHPFPCGVPVHVNCGYGPTCSPAHRRIEATSATNDHYAVDFTRVDSANGYDKAVVSVASGVVLYAGWTRGGWRPYGQLVYIEHTFREDGHRYQTLYAHLNKVKVKVGQRVRAGTVIGTLGGSSMGRLGKFGPHLHFAMYRDAKRTLGGGRAVLPEPMGHYASLRSGMDMIACGRPTPTPVASRELSRSTAAGGLFDPE